MESRSEFREQQYDIEELDTQLERVAAELKNMPHGTGLNVIESWYVAKYPPLNNFFEYADDVLELNKKQKKELIYLQNQFHSGKITDVEMEKLKKEYFNPYFFKKLGGE